MKVTDIFHGESLKAADLKGKEIELTVASWAIKEYEEGERSDKKIELHFHETDRTLICNKTNANSIAEMHGEDLDAWRGKSIVIYPTETDFAGKRVACIRVKAPLPSQEDPDKDVPF